MITYHATKYNFVHGNHNYQCAITPHNGWVFSRWPLGRPHIPSLTEVMCRGEWVHSFKAETIDYFDKYTEVEKFLE